MFSRRIKITTAEGSCTVVMPASPFVRNSSHHVPEAKPKTEREAA